MAYGMTYSRTAWLMTYSTAYGLKHDLWPMVYHVQFRFWNWHLPPDETNEAFVRNVKKQEVNQANSQKDHES